MKVKVDKNIIRLELTLEEFCCILGMTEEEFEEWFNNDPVKAIKHTYEEIEVETQ